MAQNGEKRRRNGTGIAPDGARNMISIAGETGAANRSRKRLGYLIITHDFCHCINLTIKK